jgi:hypothetical protein
MRGGASRAKDITAWRRLRRACRSEHPRWSRGRPAIAAGDGSSTSLSPTPVAPSSTRHDRITSTLRTGSSRRSTKPNAAASPTHSETSRSRWEIPAENPARRGSTHVSRLTRDQVAAGPATARRRPLQRRDRRPARRLRRDREDARQPDADETRPARPRPSRGVRVRNRPGHPWPTGPLMSQPWSVLVAAPVGQHRPTHGRAAVREPGAVALEGHCSVARGTVQRRGG